jgi:hypothetical protein
LNNAAAHQMAAIQVQSPLGILSLAPAGGSLAGPSVAARSPPLGVPSLTARSPVERVSARASVMIDTLHQGRGEDPGLQRMAVLLQRAV